MSALRTPVGPDDHARGPRSAPVTLVEYGDFQCPYARKAWRELKRLEEQLGGRLRFVFRHFPLTHLHDAALEAAEAAEAAGAQGRFWEMYDLLFEHQDELDTEAFVAFARRLGLDVHRFQQDLRSHRFRERVQRALASGADCGVSQTPTFFLDGRRYEGAYDAETLRRVIEGEGREAGI